MAIPCKETSVRPVGGSRPSQAFVAARVRISTRWERAFTVLSEILWQTSGESTPDLFHAKEARSSHPRVTADGMVFAPSTPS